MPKTRTHALAAVNAFDAAYGAKFPKAAAKITDDTGLLLAFFDYPAAGCRAGMACGCIRGKGSSGGAGGFT